MWVFGFLSMWMPPIADWEWHFLCWLAVGAPFLRPQAVVMQQIHSKLAVAGVLKKQMMDLLKMAMTGSSQAAASKELELQHLWVATTRLAWIAMVALGASVPPWFVLGLLAAAPIAQLATLDEPALAAMRLAAALETVLEEGCVLSVLL